MMMAVRTLKSSSLRVRNRPFFLTHAGPGRAALRLSKCRLRSRARTQISSTTSKACSRIW